MRRTEGLIMRYVTMLLVLAGVVAFLAPSASASPTPSCDWGTEYRSALADRGMSGWTLVDSVRDSGGGYGRSNMAAGTATVSRTTPCWAVRSVVTHEAMHLVQARYHGNYRAATAWYGSQLSLELVADCASRALGSEYTPYLWRYGDDMCRTQRHEVALLLAPVTETSEPRD
jgi:hypothetical protein